MAERPQLNDINNETGLMGIGPLPSKAPVAAFNLDQIENLLITKGFTAYHYKHALNPQRETLQGGENPNTLGAQRGVIYYEVRELKAVPQNFRLEDVLNVQGIYKPESVLINITGNYTDGDKEPIYVRPRDLIVLNPTITDVAEQLVEYNPNGPIRLNYKVKGVDYIATTDQKFRQDIDFDVKDNVIRWLSGGKKPKFVNGKGEILSIVYYITPVYIVQAVPHNLRVLPDNEIGHGALPRHARYAPQLIIAVQSHLREPNDLLDFTALPPYSGNPNSANVTGGT